jgi:hypothetical protein
VKLTAQEYKLLSYLLHHKGKVVSRTELIEHIYDQDFDRDSNTIEVFVTRIRKKLGADVITTIRGLGYSLEEPAEALNAGRPQLLEAAVPPRRLRPSRRKRRRFTARYARHRIAQPADDRHRGGCGSRVLLGRRLRARPGADPRDHAQFRRASSTSCSIR